MSRQKHYNPMAEHFDSNTKRHAPNTKLIDVTYDEIKAETPNAWLVLMPNGDEHWMPKSPCELHEHDKVIVVPLWLYEQEGIS